MPNLIAYTMLAVWPLIALMMFRKLPPEKALIWAILVAYLILPPLPAAFDLPLLPPFNKDTISHFSVLVILMFLPALQSSGIPMSISKKLSVPLVLFNPLAIRDFIRRGLAALALPETRLARLLVVLFVLVPIATVLTNPEPLVFQQKVIRGLRLPDLIALPVTQLIILIGYLLARQYLYRPDTLRYLLLALMFGGLAYSLPMLIEIRLSPQLNLWIYGYFQHLFDQMIRAGGFRPIVFLNHGIWVAFFIMTSAVSAFALWRCETSDKRILYLLASAYLAALLVLSKTLAPLLFALMLMPLLMFFGRKSQIKIAALMVSLAFAYPVMKGAHLVPVQTLLQQAEKVSSQRAGSLRFRFVNEDLLFERVAEKPLFGWGSWGRNHLHDPVTGEIKSTSDGRWIIVIGVFGWVGFIAEFGLLVLPVLLIWREVQHLKESQISPYLGPLTLILGVNMIDLLPNATLTPLTWLIAGALLGHSEMLRRARLGLKEPAPIKTTPPPAKTLI